MCSSKSKLQRVTPKLAQINGRPVLQPTSNQVPTLERHNSLKKKMPSLTTPTTPPPPPMSSSFSPPISPKLKSPRPPAVKRVNELNSSAEKVMITPKLAMVSSVKKKPKSVTTTTTTSTNSCYDSSLIADAPGSIAAARREQVAVMQEQRKLKIAHYGRTKSAKIVRIGLDDSSITSTNVVAQEGKRCSFITPNSDPIYVDYHDHEWGVPVHDDKLLFELLVLTGAQVGSDWTSVLKKRQAFREAFSGFDAEIVAKFTEKKITSISADYGLHIGQVRGVVDNSIRILEVKKEMGSFDKYLWRFVNEKPINTQYRLCNKIPVKTSKSESISKDMVRRGFRFVGPTVMHSFMQAAGLTNDHLVTCPRHHQCMALTSHDQSTVVAAL